MHPNQSLIQTFYTAFANRDAAAMVACYHPAVVFSDPVFPDLRGAQAGAMWRMLTAAAQQLTVEHRVGPADDAIGEAHWEARYLFSATGRAVHNVIDASFRFRDGKIIEHRDRFDLWRWTRMALGPTGVLLGWSPMVQNKVRRQAATNLARFVEKNGLAGP